MGLLDGLDDLWGDGPHRTTARHEEASPAQCVPAMVAAPTAAQRAGNNVAALPTFSAPDKNSSIQDERHWDSAWYRHGTNPLRRVSPANVPAWCLEGAAWALIDTGVNGWWWIRNAVPTLGYGPDFPAGVQVSFARISRPADAVDAWSSVHLRQVRTATPKPRLLYALIALDAEGVPCFTRMDDGRGTADALRHLGLEGLTPALYWVSGPDGAEARAGSWLDSRETVITRVAGGPPTVEYRTDARDPSVHVERKRLRR